MLLSKSSLLARHSLSAVAKNCIAIRNPRINKMSAMADETTRDLLRVNQELLTAIVSGVIPFLLSKCHQNNANVVILFVCCGSMLRRIARTMRRILAFVQMILPA